MMEFDLATMATRLGFALLLGGLLGLDREILRKPAGLKTHMLVSLAACSFTVLTFKIYGLVGENADPDPIRVTEAVITGVAFLGAGTIMRNRGDVEGITTGANMWLAGSVGLACGCGFFDLAALVTAIGCAVLVVVGWVTRHFSA